MRILVTGATGTVGSQVVRELEAGTTTVRAASRNPAAARGAVDAEEYVDFDFGRPETWGAALADFDRLFLVRPPELSNVDPILAFLDAAERSGVDHVVALSVLGAEKNPLLPHRRIERHIEASGLGYSFLRASFFMQNFLTDHQQDVLGGEISVPAGNGETSFVDARDVAAVAAFALKSEAHRRVAYDLTGPAALTYHEVARIFTNVLDRPITYSAPSLPTFAWQRYRDGTPLGKVIVMCGIYTTARLGFAGRVTTDVERLLGREPLDFTTFVAEYADQFDPGDAAAISPDRRAK